MENIDYGYYYDLLIYLSFSLCFDKQSAINGRTRGTPSHYKVWSYKAKQCNKDKLEGYYTSLQN